MGIIHSSPEDQDDLIACHACGTAECLSRLPVGRGGWAAFDVADDDGAAVKVYACPRHVDQVRDVVTVGAAMLRALGEAVVE